MLCRERKSLSTGKISAVVMAACGKPCSSPPQFFVDAVCQAGCRRSKLAGYVYFMDLQQGWDMLFCLQGFLTSSTSVHLA